MIFYLYMVCAVLHGAIGFYRDIIQGDRTAATYNIAWLGVFLALAGLNP
jgi:hypothetical protein